MKPARRPLATLALALSAAAGVAPVHAATITNPSFEADLYQTYPGYTSGNGGTLTGWTLSHNDRGGVNAVPTTFSSAQASPFANNGVIPAGTQAGFLQAVTATPATTLSTTLTDLVPGTTYRVSFAFNARNNGVAANQRPNMTVAVGGTSASFQAAPVQAASTFTSPYRQGAVVFTATATTAQLQFTNTITGATSQTDATFVLDNVQIAAAAPTTWTTTAWNGDATSGISSGLSYTHAYNFGDAPTATSINGVAFTAVAGANPALGGSFSTSGWTSPLADAANAVITAGGGSAALASNFLYGGASQTTQALTLDGLTAGQQYRATFFGVGWTDAANGVARSFLASDGTGDTSIVNEHQFGTDNGVRFDVTYTATGSSHTLSFAPTSINTTFHLYGFANAVVPEPGTLGLAALSALGLLRRRRLA